MTHLNKKLRFHWRLVLGGESDNTSRMGFSESQATALPDIERMLHFCHCAEESGIDSLLTAFAYYMPDPLILATALARATKKIKFLIAYRSGIMSPTLFVQQLNTLSALSDGRFSLNIVAGHSPEEQGYYGDFLLHDERYARTEEFLAICNAFWRSNENVNFQGKHYRIEKGIIKTPFLGKDRSYPEIYIAGNSPAAIQLALSQGDCWLRFPDSPENLKAEIEPILEQGKEVGIRLAIISRPTKQEAIDAAYTLINSWDPTNEERQKEKDFVQKSDSVGFKQNLNYAEYQEWLTPCLWMGAVPTHGVATAALVGTPEEIAETIIDYKKVGVTQFVFSGWPKLKEMLFFGKEILPLIRKKESTLYQSSPR